MTVRLFSIVIAATCFAANAFAYVPSSKFILGRLAKNSGKGYFQVEQEVQFRTETDPVVLREKWIVGNGDALRVTVTGSKGASESYRYEALYKDGKRQYVDATGTV